MYLYILIISSETILLLPSEKGIGKSCDPLTERREFLAENMSAHDFILVGYAESAPILSTLKKGEKRMNKAEKYILGLKNQGLSADQAFFATAAKLGVDRGNVAYRLPPEYTIALVDVYHSATKEERENALNQLLLHR